MKNKALLITIAFCIPLFAYLSAVGLRYKMEHDWSAAVNAEPTAHDASGQLTERGNELLSLETACSPGEGGPAAVCDIYASYDLLQEGSVWTAVGTASLLLLIALMGFAARFNRYLLLAFVPGIFLTLVALAALILINSALLIYSLYALMTTFLSRIPVGFFIAVGLGALLAIFRMISASRVFIRKATTVVVGKRLNESENPALLAHIANLCRSMGSLKPDHIIVGLDPNFFVTEANLRCLDGVFTGRSLYLSLPLCRLMTDRELDSVLAHEFGHFVGNDTQLSRRFYPVYRGTSESLGALLDQSQASGAGAIPALPAALILTYFLHSFSDAERHVSRDRELCADTLAARAIDAVTFASALVKIHAYAPLWLSTKNQMSETLKSGKQIINASTLFAALVSSLAPALPLDELGVGALPHPTDTHPPLGLRLKSLHIPIDNVSEAVRLVSPERSSSALFADIGSLEEELSDAENAILAA